MARTFSTKSLLQNFSDLRYKLNLKNEKINPVKDEKNIYSDVK